MSWLKIASHEEERRCRRGHSAISFPLCTHRWKCEDCCKEEGEVVVVIGGINSKTTRTDEVWLFFTDTCQWKCVSIQRSPLPHMYFHTAAYQTQTGAIWLFGGNSFSSLIRLDLDIGELALNWKEVPCSNEPSDRQGHSCVTYGHQLIFFGGKLCRFAAFSSSRASLLTNDLYIWNMQTAQWKKLEVPNGPSPRFGHSASIVDSRMILHGGRGLSSIEMSSSQCTVDFTQVFNDVFVLDLGMISSVQVDSNTSDKLQWKNMKEIINGDNLKKRAGHSAAFVDDHHLVLLLFATSYRRGLKVITGGWEGTVSAEGFDTGAISLDEICVINTSNYNHVTFLFSSGTFTVRNCRTTGTVPTARDGHSTTLINVHNRPALLLLFGTDAAFNYLGLFHHSSTTNKDQGDSYLLDCSGIWTPSTLVAITLRWIKTNFPVDMPQKSSILPFELLQGICESKSSPSSRTDQLCQSNGNTTS